MKPATTPFSEVEIVPTQLPTEEQVATRSLKTFHDDDALAGITHFLHNIRETREVRDATGAVVAVGYINDVVVEVPIEEHPNYPFNEPT